IPAAVQSASIFVLASSILAWPALSPAERSVTPWLYSSTALFSRSRPLFLGCSELGAAGWALLGAGAALLGAASWLDAGGAGGAASLLDAGGGASDDEASGAASLDGVTGAAGSADETGAGSSDEAGTCFGFGLGFGCGFGASEDTGAGGGTSCEEAAGAAGSSDDDDDDGGAATSVLGAGLGSSLLDGG